MFIWAAWQFDSVQIVPEGGYMVYNEMWNKVSENTEGVVDE